MDALSDPEGRIPPLSDNDMDTSSYPEVKNSISPGDQESTWDHFVDFSGGSSDLPLGDNHLSDKIIPILRVSPPKKFGLPRTNQKMEVFIDSSPKDSLPCWPSVSPGDHSATISKQLVFPPASPSPSSSRRLFLTPTSQLDHKEKKKLKKPSSLRQKLSSASSAMTPSSRPPSSPSRTVFFSPSRTMSSSLSTISSRATSSSSHTSPSPTPVEFVVKSPQKSGKVGKLPKVYAPQDLLNRMDSLGFQSMDPDDAVGIQEFFEEVIKVQTLLRTRNREEEGKWTIPGYESVLESWVLEFALEEIPSKNALSTLPVVVILPFLFLHLPPLTFFW
jgi:hypothetical protein